jgi:hypothetical protein
MSLRTARAYFEFLGMSTVRITTSFYQKTFSINENCTIDLLTLKKYPKRDYFNTKSPSDFFVDFLYNEEFNLYSAEVYGRTSKSEFDLVGSISYIDRNKNFKLAWNE